MITFACYHKIIFINKFIQIKKMKNLGITQEVL